jgi:23S rRNA pseudoU1915 N3-methylase RlmH
MNEVKKNLAEIKATQRELKESVQRMTIAIESVAKSSQNLSDVFESMKSYIVVIGGMQPLRKEGFSSVEVFNLFKQTWTPLAELKVPRLASSAVLFEN